MSTLATSVAMTGALHEELSAALLREDGQEDLRLITYAMSTGGDRRTALLNQVVIPQPGDHWIHGNASFSAQYVLRAAATAAHAGLGVALAHSHPGATGWQAMSGPDYDAESAFGNLVREITRLPLVGLTLAGGSGDWSARHWDHDVGTEIRASPCDSVRVFGSHLAVSWNDALRPVHPAPVSQRRTISAWGETIQGDLVRRRVLVVGLGSVGLDIAVRLAASGVAHIGLMDFDTVDDLNLDRMIGATREDARRHTPKIDVAARCCAAQATHTSINVETYNLSICEPEGLRAALDYDVIVSCVDRPWPRAVLNELAYTDLIPVIDGGIAIDAFADGGMRNATWRSHVVGPGRTCMSCTGQLNLAHVPLEIAGLLDDPEYITGSGLARPGASNVALLSISVSASLLAQYVSLNVAPGGIGDPGPMQYWLSTHSLEHLESTTAGTCRTEKNVGVGDARIVLTGQGGVPRSHRTYVLEQPREDLPGTVDGPTRPLRSRVWRRCQSILRGDRHSNCIKGRSDR